jgi:hypothetical protein
MIFDLFGGVVDRFQSDGRQHCFEAYYFKRTAGDFRGLQERFGSNLPIRSVSLLEIKDQFT